MYGEYLNEIHDMVKSLNDEMLSINLKTSNIITSTDNLDKCCHIIEKDNQVFIYNNLQYFKLA